MKLFVVPNFEKEHTKECVSRLQECLEGCDCTLMFQKRCEEHINCCDAVLSEDVQTLLEECDAVVAIGGDGTVIHTAKIAAEAQKPVLGINTGRIGFIAGMEHSEPELIRRLLTGEYSVEKRMLLDVDVIRANGDNIFSGHAVNDAVVSRGELSHIIDLTVKHNDRIAMDFRADGLIISTPTGSTAYALSAGGPVIDPTVQCIELAPVCAYSLMSRPIIFNGDSVISIKAQQRPDEGVENSERRHGAFLSVDGELSIPLGSSDEVRVQRSDISADFIVIKKQSFAEVLKSKFKG